MSLLGAPVLLLGAPWRRKRCIDDCGGPSGCASLLLIAGLTGAPLSVGLTALRYAKCIGTLSAYFVEKLDFRPRQENSSPVDATTCLGHGRPSLAVENSVDAFLVHPIALGIGIIARNFP